MSELPIRRFLDLSTSHLRKKTCGDLNGWEGVTAYETKYGWLMYATAEAEEFAEEYRWPSELLPIVLLARANGCDYVMFDRDGPTVDGLPTWDW